MNLTHCCVIFRKSKPLTLDFQPSEEAYKSFYVRPELAKKSPLYEDHDRVQAWPAVNILLTGMADGSLWGGTKNKKILEASSAHEVEILFRSVVYSKPCLLRKSSLNILLSKSEVRAVLEVTKHSRTGSM